MYGCILGNDLKARHIRATTLDERNLMRGSKYIASNMSGVYQAIEHDLKSGHYVCFSGTPCQVAAVKKYISSKHIKIDNEQLFTIEVICHGVAVDKFFDDYINNLEKKYKSKAVSCKFRAKHRPGARQDVEVVFSNGKRYTSPSTRYDWFYSVYLKNLVLKPACYHCKFAVPERNADISIADYWEKGKTLDRAHSTIIINSRFGNEVWQLAKIDMDWREIDESEAYFPNMHHPTEKPNDYDKFWGIYNKEGYLAAQRYVGNNTVKGKLKFLIIKRVDYIRSNRAENSLE